jgi:hypothetical protein
MNINHNILGREKKVQHNKGTYVKVEQSVGDHIYAMGWRLKLEEDENNLHGYEEFD